MSVNYAPIIDAPQEEIHPILAKYSLPLICNGFPTAKSI